VWTRRLCSIAAHLDLLNGSVLTAKHQLQHVDAVVLLAENFRQQIERGDTAALELERMILTRYPEEMFAAEDEADWLAWVEFFSRTREAEDRRKGLVEVKL
jgi:hypothetical protein